MAAQAGDTVFSLDTLFVDADGVCRAQLAVSVVDKDSTLHGIRKQVIPVTLTDEQKAQLTALRAAIVATLTATPPEGLTAAVPVAAKTTAARMGERRAKRNADRGIDENTLPVEGNNPPGGGHGGGHGGGGRGGRP